MPRAKLRASIHRVDPEGTAQRRSIAIKRRIYHVAHTNGVWHINGHHKLIRWCFVVYRGIVGYSRTITNAVPITKLLYLSRNYICPKPQLPLMVKTMLSRNTS